MTDFINKAQSASDAISIDVDFSVEADKTADLPEFDIKEPEIKEFTYNSDILDDIGQIDEASEEKTESEMKTQEFVDDLNANQESQVWKIDISKNDGFPIF
mgnify:CR=1 FL=1